jgi:hypothetical protein
MMLLAELIRDQVRDLGDGDDDDVFALTTPSWKRDWTWMDHLAYAVKKSGFYGNDELVGDVLGGLVEGGPRKAVAEAGGVVASDIDKYLQYGKVPLPGGDLVKWG